MIDTPADEAWRYGFRWGPMTVTRLCHVLGRGYSLEIETEHKRMQIYISEQGRIVRAYRMSGETLEA